ncbi:FAD-dependent oxidoreductase [Prevotella sp.]|uniref:FAD-dependent oxidoreductase n=1 Tax=Prevotella sp. TaxID=59823 RepID=UPI002F959B1B
MDERVVKNLIIGFGKAGKTLAADMAGHGETVMLVEESNTMYGGTCINVGCIPSKKLIVEGEKGQLTADKKEVFARAMALKEALIGKLRDVNYHKVADLEGVEVVDATASFVDSHRVRLIGKDGETLVKADRIFINTGSSPNQLKIAGADSKRVYDSTGLLSLEERPDRLVIIGGGYISLEFAFMYQAFGSKVTILDAGDVFLPREDRDIAEEMLRVLTSKGIEVRQGARTERIEDHETAVTVVTNGGDIEAEAVLVAIGRHSNTARLQLDKAGVGMDNRGNIVTDEHLKAAPHIWAMGDVAGHGQFTYLSLDDYRIVSSQLFGDGSRTTLNRGAIPTSVFTDPTLSHIGLTETEARRQGLDITVRRLPAMAIPKAKVLGKTDGLLKEIVDNHTGEVLGTTLFCAESHELINLFKVVIDHHIPASYVRNMIFTHPTMAEGLNDL